MLRIVIALCVVALAYEAQAQSLLPESAFLGEWTTSPTLGCENYHDGLLTVERQIWRSHESTCTFQDVEESGLALSARLACWVEGEEMDIALEARLVDQDVLAVSQALSGGANRDSEFHRCSTFTAPSSNAQAGTPIVGDTPDDYLAGYRKIATAAAAASPSILTQSGFEPKALASKIVTSLGIGGHEPIAWITFAEWLAMVAQAGKVDQYEPLAAADDRRIFGLRVKTVNRPSFDIVFQRDFDQIFLHHVQGLTGQLPEGDLIMVLAAGFNPRDYAGGNVGALPAFDPPPTSAPGRKVLERLAGRWLSTRSGDACSDPNVLKIVRDRMQIGDQGCEITVLNDNVTSPTEAAGSLKCTGPSGDYSGSLFLFPDDPNLISVSEELPGERYSSNYERCQ